VRHEKTFVSIPKDLDPLSITLEEADALLQKKRKAEEENFIKAFDEDADLRVMNGRFGPYISYQRKNYKIPEGVEPADLTHDACLKIVELQKDKATTRKTRTTGTKAASTEKTTAAKKATAKKATTAKKTTAAAKKTTAKKEKE
jgi:DNA topoisomerase-1